MTSKVLLRLGMHGLVYARGTWRGAKGATIGTGRGGEEHDDEKYISILLQAAKDAQAQAPTHEIVEKSMKPSWEKAASSLNPRSTFKLNEVKFGKPYKAKLVDVEIEHIPEGAMVTPAIVDFTVRTYYNNETQALRRVREAQVYQDSFGEWAVKTGSARGEDTRTVEPASK